MMVYLCHASLILTIKLQTKHFAIFITHMLIEKGFYSDQRQISTAK